MKKVFLLTLTALIAISCVTTGKCAEQTHHELKANEIDAIIGQWDYDLLTKDGTKIKGFFQVEPSGKDSLSVVGQAYFDKGTKTLSTKNLRGIWTGLMRRDKLEQNYVLAFAMRENPIYPTNTQAEPSYHGTIYFHHKNEILDGKFSDHDSREGIGGTITAYRHQ
jgi:hypothetical protein